MKNNGHSEDLQMPISLPVEFATFQLAKCSLPSRPSSLRQLTKFRSGMGQRKNRYMGITYMCVNSFVNIFCFEKYELCPWLNINIDLLKSTHCQYAHDFLSTLLSCYLIPTIDKPTRVHRSSATLIDIYSLIIQSKFRSVDTSSPISDHFSQFCLTKSTKASNISKKKKVRDFSNFSAESFRDDVCQVRIPWNTLTENGGNDVDKLCSSFYNKLNKIVNKHAPMKVLSQRKAK